MSPTVPGKHIRRVLVIAYLFPPVGGAGVQRVTKFVRYLPEVGWDCSVLTVANPSVPVFDESLAEEIPDSTVVRRAPTFEPGYALKNSVSAGTEVTAGAFSPWRLAKNILRATGNAVLQPDPQILWYPRAVRAGRRLLKELDHDAIFVTAPPFSSFLVGASLSRWSGLPLILDYRDEWGISNLYQENRQKSGLSHWVHERLQRKVLRQANSVVATTRRSAQALQQRIRESGSDACVTHIYNGYDRTDIPTGGTPAVQPVAGPERFRMAYVGTLWNLTDISPLVNSLRELSSRSPDLAAKIELIVAGRRTAEQDAMLDQLNDLPCGLIRKGYLSHGEAIEVMQTSHELVLLLSDVPEAERVMPAKTFEYLALRKNILAIAPSGEMTELLEACPYAESFQPGDTGGIAGHLEKRAAEGVLMDEGQMDWEPTQYERRFLTEQLSGVLCAATGILSGAENEESAAAAILGADR